MFVNVFGCVSDSFELHFRVLVFDVLLTEIEEKRNAKFDNYI